MELLHRLDRLAAETLQPSDLVAGWFEEFLAIKLATAGMLPLERANARISADRRFLRASHADSFSCALG